MANEPKHKNKKETPVYLTKRILIQRARAGIKKAEKEAMLIAGYLVVAEDGWVVKKYKDGTVERIKKIATVSNENLAFD